MPQVVAIHDSRYPAQAIARTLRHAREAAGLTQEQVAARMGTPRNAVTRLESPKSQPPSMRQVIKYADACGVTLYIEARPKASPDAPAVQAIAGAEGVKTPVRRNRSRPR
ncbi:MAG TPA: helix-turn-helix transcriptional regulator [Oscillatoriaceae cyanobacterium]